MRRWRRPDWRRPLGHTDALLGCIDEVLGGFVATEARGEAVGRFLELGGARSPLGRRSSETLRKPRSRMTKTGLTAMAGTGRQHSAPPMTPTLLALGRERGDQGMRPAGSVVGSRQTKARQS